MQRAAILNEHFKLPSSPTEAVDNCDRAVPPEQSLQGDVDADGTTGPLDETSVDEQGRICFYGSTSHFHVEPQSAESPGTARVPALPRAALQSDGESPSAGSTLNYSGITASAGLGSSTDSVLLSVIGSEITAEFVDELLEVYWCWPHHLHRVLCRRIFISEPSRKYWILSDEADFARRTSAPFKPLRDEVPHPRRTFASGSLLRSS